MNDFAGEMKCERTRRRLMLGRNADNVVSYECGMNSVNSVVVLTSEKRELLTKPTKVERWRETSQKLEL